MKLVVFYYLLLHLGLTTQTLALLVLIRLKVVYLVVELVVVLVEYEVVEVEGEAFSSQVDLNLVHLS